MHKNALESAIAMNDKLFAQQAEINRLKQLLLDERVHSLGLRNALGNCKTHLEMQGVTDGFSQELKEFPFNPDAAIQQADEAIEKYATAANFALEPLFNEVDVAKIERDQYVKKTPCLACGGSSLSPYPDDGGSCPHCFNGEVEAV
jgi:hypothetical protein